MTAETPDRPDAGIESLAVNPTAEGIAKVGNTLADEYKDVLLNGEDKLHRAEFLARNPVAFLDAISPRQFTELPDSTRAQFMHAAEVVQTFMDGKESIPDNDLESARKGAVKLQRALYIGEDSPHSLFRGGRPVDGYSSADRLVIAWALGAFTEAFGAGLRDAQQKEMPFARERTKYFANNILGAKPR